MDFAVFVLLNAVLLIRPEELLPDIAGLRLYLIVIGLSVLTAGPRLLNALRPAELAAQPITVCVLGVWVAGILSQVVRGQVGLAADFAGEFGKVVLYYLLLVAVIDTPARLRAFLGCVVAFVVVLTSLALFQYHGAIDLDALRPLERRQNFDPESNEWEVFIQLRSTGIYNDPNDFCLILVTGLLCSLYRATTGSGWTSRFFWLLTAGLFGYAVFLTQSRGGLLGLMVAVLVWAYGYYGWRKTVPFALAMFVAVAAMGNTRQTEMNLGRGDTGHQRVMLWSDGFVEMMRNPVTGIGVGEFGEEMGLVAHNSFVHTYVETGLLGGGLFLGAFVLSTVELRRTIPPTDPVLRGLLPFVLAIVVGYAAGAFSLSRSYIVPTYMILGLATAYLRQPEVAAQPSRLRFNARTAAMLAGLGVVGMIALKAITVVLMASGG